MSAPVMPRIAVDAPPAPVPHRYGLFTAATVLENVQPHELLGVEYQAVCNPQVDLYPAPACPPPDPLVAKTPKPTTAPAFGTPFALYAADECLLGREQNTAIGQLRQRFLTGEETAVERAIAGGEYSWPHFALATVIDPGDAVGVDGLALGDAVGLLDQWLATHWGGTGAIHAPAWLAYRAMTDALVMTSGPRALTLLGDSWVFGAGYTGGPPSDVDTGVDDGMVWLYATPPIRVRRSGLTEPATWNTGAFDREQNLGFLLAERLYTVDWPCGVAAVKTTIPRVAAAEMAPAEGGGG